MSEAAIRHSEARASTLVVYLVPAAQGRFELYSEAPDGPDGADEPTDGATGRPGRFRRAVLAASAQWHDWVERARQGGDHGRIARWRDRIVRALAESIAEQRTLWALRNRLSVEARYPSALDDARAKHVVHAALGHARRHHLRWWLVDAVGFVCSALLMPIPGPNVVAFYFAFRLVGHWQSWRGAKHALERSVWRFEADASLAELAGLVDVPREVRAARVEAIAERLQLARLSAFFDRVAIPSA